MVFTQLQAKILEYLKEIDKICRDNDIEYYLCGGTLIGVLRHEGFIPWDDDADILMTRDNWEKFKNVFKEGKFPEGRSLTSFDINPDYPNVFGRYVDLTSTAIHSFQWCDDEPAGMVIDIFPLDPLPADPKIHQQYLDDLNLISDLQNKFSNYGYRHAASKEIYVDALKEIEEGRRDELYAKLVKRSFSYTEEESEYYGLRWAGHCMFHKKDIYGTPKEALFEDSYFMIPKESEEYLYLHYGLDWVEVPEVKERQSHEAIYNFDIDYKTMREKYLKGLYDRKEVMDTMLSRKLMMFENEKFAHNFQDECLNLRGVNLKLSILKRIEDEKIDVEQLLREKRYAEIIELFSTYIDAAYSRKFIGRGDFAGTYRLEHPFIIDIDIKYYEAIIIALSSSGFVAKTERLLDAYRISGRELTPRLQKVCDLIVETKNASVLFWKEQWKEAEKLVDDLMIEHPDMQKFIYMKLMILVHKDETVDYDSYNALVAKADALYPDNGEIEKCKGDLAVKEGRTLDALVHFYKFHLNSNNGSLALKVKHWLKDNAEEIEKVWNYEFFREFEDPADFLDYLCEQSEDQETYLKLRIRSHLAMGESQEEYATLCKKVLAENLGSMEEKLTLMHELYQACNIAEEDYADFDAYVQAYGDDEKIKAFLETHEEDGDATKLMLRALAYADLHKADQAYVLYRKVKAMNPSPLAEAMIQNNIIADMVAMRERIQENKYPDQFFIHTWEKRFGETKTVESILQTINEMVPETETEMEG